MEEIQASSLELMLNTKNLLKLTKIFKNKERDQLNDKELLYDLQLLLKKQIHGCLQLHSRK
jgi:hypothetical protein